MRAATHVGGTCRAVANCLWPFLADSLFFDAGRCAARLLLWLKFNAWFNKYVSV